MTKLKIVYDDKSSITYTIKKNVDWIPYWNRHKDMRKSMLSATLQEYPKSKYAPIDLLKEY